jgi:hypothetical protein
MRIQFRCRKMQNWEWRYLILWNSKRRKLWWCKEIWVFKWNQESLWQLYCPFDRIQGAFSFRFCMRLELLSICSSRRRLITSISYLKIANWVGTCPFLQVGRWSMEFPFRQRILGEKRWTSSSDFRHKTQNVQVYREAMASPWRAYERGDNLSRCWTSWINAQFIWQVSLFWSASLLCSLNNLRWS